MDSNTERYLERAIKSTYGDVVSFASKSKFLHKFGRRATSLVQNVPTTVANLAGEAEEVLRTGNTIDSISSGDAGDDQIMVLEGHTLDSSGFNFVVQEVTLTGQTPALLRTPLARCTRVYVADGTIAAPSTAPAGAVYVFDSSAAGGTLDGVPNNAPSVAIELTAGSNQSHKCATAYSKRDYGAITAMTVSCTRASSSAANVDFLLEEKHLEGVWRPTSGIVSLRSTSQNFAHLRFDPPLIVRKNSDMRITAIAGAAGADVSAAWHSYLGLVLRPA